MIGLRLFVSPQIKSKRSDKSGQRPNWKLFTRRKKSAGNIVNVFNRVRKGRIGKKSSRYIEYLLCLLLWGIPLTVVLLLHLVGSGRASTARKIGALY